MSREREFLPACTLAEDRRLSIDRLYASYEKLVTQGGWGRYLVCWQEISMPDVPLEEKLYVPIYVYTNATPNPDNPNRFIEPIDGVLISTVHGREPAGANTFADDDCTNQLIAAGEDFKIALLPCCNPFGYFWNLRCGTQGWQDKTLSVGECEALLRPCETPASFEAKHLTQFLSKFDLSQAVGIDLHEDPFWEDVGRQYEDSHGTYIYVVRPENRESPLTLTVLNTLRANHVPLLEYGKTRFEEPIINGIVVGGNDGSLDEWLAMKGVTPMITVECLLRTPNDPPLSERVGIYTRVLEEVFDQMKTS